MNGLAKKVMLAGAGVFFCLLGPWLLAVWLGVKPVILPPIGKVVRTGMWLLQSDVLIPAFVVSTVRVNVGFALAALMAVPLGFLLGRSSWLFFICEPIMESFRFLIAFAWIPIAILWFGVHESGKIFIIWYAGFFVILLHGIAAVRGVDPDLIKAARTLGAGERAIFYKVVLPAAMPVTMTGLRLGFGACWIALIAAEMVAAKSGLGFLIMDAREFLQTDVVIVGMAVIAVVGATYNWILEWIQRNVFRHPG